MTDPYIKELQAGRESERVRANGLQREVNRLESVVIRLTHEKDAAVERYSALEDEVLNLSRQLGDLRGARLPQDGT